MRLYNEAFAAEPALAAQFRYWASCDAVKAATGRDTEMIALGVEEWGYLTSLALKWLQADLAQRVSQAKDPKRSQDVRDQLMEWKNNPDLAPVCESAWLAAMPQADRKAWEAFWSKLDGVLASIDQNAVPPSSP